jgi:hypothetical protein
MLVGSIGLFLFGYGCLVEWPQKNTKSTENSRFNKVLCVLCFFVANFASVGLDAKKVRMNPGTHPVSPLRAADAGEWHPTTWGMKRVDFGREIRKAGQVSRRERVSA